jgi:hypothetical protein
MAQQAKQEWRVESESQMELHWREVELHLQEEKLG